MRFTGLGSVLLALLACGRGDRKAAPVDAGTSPPAAPERVARTLPLELGEGDDRSLKIPAWPADGSPKLDLPAGTRIEKLDDLGNPPSGMPKPGTPWRVRVTEGPHKGLVAYVLSYQTQAAR